MIDIEAIRAKVTEGKLIRGVEVKALIAEVERLKAERDAAVEDIYKMMDKGECDICKHYNHDNNTCAQPFVHYDECFEWRGPQEAGGGEA